MTIADSLVLVFGIALALSLPWYNGWVQLPQPVMEPWWRIISLFVEEPVGKASLALIPLMLYRRARLGGLCRPGELLLAVCASYGHSWAITTFWTTRRTAAREGTDSPQRSQRPPRREPSQESGSGGSGGRKPDALSVASSACSSAVSAISAVNLGAPSRRSPRSGPWDHGGDRRDVSKL